MVMLERIINIVEKFWPVLLKGLGVTMEMTLISVLGGFILGIALALSRIYGNKFLRIISTGFIEIIRGTPLLVQLFILYFGLPPYGFKPSPFTAAIIGFIINSGAYQAEYLRGSILSIRRNQMIAARSLGMTRKQAIIHVIMPQALRRVIPAWTNEFIYLLKYTSLAYIVGAPELMAQAKFIASRNFQFFEVYLVVAVIYLIVILFFTWLFGRLEKKVKIPGLEWVR